jgi:hypothetical protein
MSLINNDTARLNSELPEIEGDLIIADSAKNYMKDQLLMEETLLQCERQKSQNSTLRLHLSKFLDEAEERFNRTSEFESPEACIDYLDAAKFMASYYGRVNNKVVEAKHWYDNYSLPYKTN